MNMLSDWDFFKERMKVEWIKESSTLKIEYAYDPIYKEGIYESDSGYIGEYRVKNGDRYEESCKCYFVPAKRKYQGDHWVKEITKWKPDMPEKKTVIEKYVFNGRNLKIEEVFLIKRIMDVLGQGMGVCLRYPNIHQDGWTMSPPVKRIHNGKIRYFFNASVQSINNFGHFLWAYQKACNNEYVQKIYINSSLSAGLLKMIYYNWSKNGLNIFGDTGEAIEQLVKEIKITSNDLLKALNYYNS